jgi:hypothetical protein
MVSFRKSSFRFEVRLLDRLFGWLLLKILGPVAAAESQIRREYDPE